MTVDGLLAFGDMGCGLVVAAFAKHSDRFEKNDLDKLGRLSDGERASMRPLLEASVTVWSGWFQNTPEGAFYTACGLYGFALFTRYRTVKAMDKLVEKLGAELDGEQPPKAQGAPAPRAATPPADSSSGLPPLPKLGRSGL